MELSHLNATQKRHHQSGHELIGESGFVVIKKKVDICCGAAELLVINAAFMVLWEHLSSYI